MLKRPSTFDIMIAVLPLITALTEVARKLSPPKPKRTFMDYIRDQLGIKKPLSVDEAERLIQETFQLDIPPLEEEAALAAQVGAPSTAQFQNEAAFKAELSIQGRSQRKDPHPEFVPAPITQSELDELIEERKATNGSWASRAEWSQLLKEHMRESPNWAGLSPQHKEALEMLAVKQSRILYGNPYQADHWLDIEGYASLARKGD